MKLGGSTSFLSIFCLVLGLLLPPFATATDAKKTFCSPRVLANLSKSNGCPISGDASRELVKPEDRRRFLLDCVIQKADVGSLLLSRLHQLLYLDFPKQGAARYPPMVGGPFVGFSRKMIEE